MNSGPIWRGSARRAAPDSSAAFWSSVAFRSGLLASRRQTELEQKFALRYRAEGSKAERRRAVLDGGEIDMSGEVGLARHGQWIGEAVAMDSLECVADAGLGVTVISEQRSDRRLLGPLGKC